MKFTNLDIETFVQQLASNAPVPGGGGGAAAAGALGVALGNMVGSLTVNKKKYADVQDDIIKLKDSATTLQNTLLDLVQQDAEVFEPLSKAYGLPSETPEQKQHKANVMEAALCAACDVPLEIMQACCEGIKLHEGFAAKGSAIAISDVGVGVALCKAALQGASLNVFINTKAMKNAEHAAKCNAQAEDMLNTYLPLADKIYEDVLARLR